MNETAKTERFFGLDFLRILSMFMIVILHILGRGGVLEFTAKGSAQSAAVWLMESGAFCAVNCYALISGYMSIHSTYRISRLASLWLEVFAYSVAITACIWLRVPSAVTGSDWLHAFFPVAYGQYWYFTAYFGMFIFMPILNAAVKGLSQKQLLEFLTAAVIFFMVLPCIVGQDIFRMYSGYSMVWLSVMYLAGAYLRRYSVPSFINKGTAALIYLVSTIVCWLVKLSGSEIILQYTSPLVFLSAFGLFVFFEKTQFRGKFTVKVISLLTPASFGVYLIHNHPLLNEYYMGARFIFLADKSTPVLVCAVLSFAGAIYIGCTLIDAVRIKIFKMLGVEKRFERLDVFGLKAESTAIE